MEPTTELEKSKAPIIIKVIEYLPNAVVSKNIVNQRNITALSFYTGKELAEKASPFDTNTQIIDDKGEVIINDKNFILN